MVLERGRIGDPLTASYGRTRSFRNDYLDATYARLAHEAFRLWREFEARTGTSVLVRCGCLNIAKRSVTPDLAATYAQLSHETLDAAGAVRRSRFGADALRRRFPLPRRGHRAPRRRTRGVVDVPAVTRALTRSARRARGRDCSRASSRPRSRATAQLVRVTCDAGELATRSLVVTAGHGTNDVLSRLSGCALQVPLAKDRPSEASYFHPPAHAREHFTADAMPVIAYLDAGIYCHPIVDGLVDAVKIGYYDPPDLRRGTARHRRHRRASSRQCMPGLRDATSCDVEDVDQCDYDLVADDDFVLGAIPGVAQRVRRRRLARHRLQVRAVGRARARRAGPRRTAPSTTSTRFDPARFEEGGTAHDPPVAAQPAAASR